MGQKYASIYRFICFSSFICPTIYLSSSDILYLHPFLSMYLVLFLSLYIYFILLAKYKSSLGTNIRIHSFNSTVRLSNLFPAPHICKYFNLSSIYLINNLSVQRSIYPFIIYLLSFFPFALNQFILCKQMEEVI